MELCVSNQICSIHRSESEGGAGPSALGLEVARICQTNTEQETFFFFFNQELKVAPNILL